MSKFSSPPEIESSVKISAAYMPDIFHTLNLCMHLQNTSNLHVEFTFLHLGGGGGGGRGLHVCSQSYCHDL